MRYSILFFSMLFIALSLYWFYGSDGSYSIESYVQNGDLLTLETKYTAEDIMDMYKKELIGATGRTFQDPTIQFHPYLLLTVKYYDKNHKTKQGQLVWSQMDGEMVLDTETWEQTRGFGDAINASATPLEFRVLNALAENKGLSQKERLQKELNMEADPLSALIESLKQKQLVVVKGNEIALHFENPLFNVLPQTKMNAALVMKPYRQGKKIGARYGRSKIEKIARAAFGSEFTILESEEIFLPVLRISMLNQDGSMLITDWNAVSGNKLSSGAIRTR